MIPDLTIDQQKLAIEIFERLKRQGHDAENPVIFARIEKLYPMVTDALFSDMAHWLSVNGYPMGSTNKGYYWARDWKQMDRSCAVLKGKISRTREKLEAQERIRDRMKANEMRLLDHPTVKTIEREFGMRELA